MKLLYIIDWPIDSIGGAQKSTYTLAKEMSKKKINVFLICPKSNKAKKNDGINYLFHNITGNSFMDKIKKSKYYLDIIHQYNFDVIHIQNPTSFSLFSLILLFDRKIHKKSKLIFTDRDFYSAYSKKQQFFYKHLSKKFDYIICTTKINKEQWSEFSDNVVSISNVLDNDWYDYDEKRFLKLKKEDKFQDKFVIGFAGRFVQYKRWDTVLKICSELNDESIIFSFAFAAANEKEVMAVNDFIINVKRECINEIIYKINIDSNEMKDFYYVLDFFILTSENESFGRTLIEAMSKKTIVFGTNSGGVPSVIGNENYLFEVNDWKFIVTKIKVYFKQKNHIMDEKEYFYKYFNENFSVDNLIDRHLRLYTKKDYED